MANKDFVWIFLLKKNCCLIQILLENFSLSNVHACLSGGNVLEGKWHLQQGQKE